MFIEESNTEYNLPGLHKETHFSLMMLFHSYILHSVVVESA